MRVIKQLVTRRDPRARRVLVGYTEGGWSVQVPLRCKTLQDARAWLRPAGVYEDTPRQGEWFFVRRDPPDADETAPNEWGTWSETIVEDALSFDRRDRHHPDECVRVYRRGETAFRGRKHIRTHRWVGRPRFFVRGDIMHPEHETLTLTDWHEVIPNQAHGPFAVGSWGGGMD
jgi:hypothetical protein